MSLRKSRKKVDPNLFTCEFCKKGFKQEKTLINHCCEKKRRWLHREDRVYHLAFLSYSRFYELSFPKMKKRTYHDFMNSQYFSAFSNFAHHLQNLEMRDAHNFIDFLIKNNVALKEWTKMYVYEKFIRERNKKESIDDAAERNILIMKEWALENDTKWYNFFREVDIQDAKYLIKTGRLSPWMLFIGPGDDIFSRMEEKDIVDIQGVLDVEIWRRKIAVNKIAVNNIVEILKDAGI